MHAKPSHENQSGGFHTELIEKKQFCVWEHEVDLSVSRQTAPEHTPLLPSRHIRALGNGHNWHQGPTVPSLSGGDTKGDTVKQSLTLAMIAKRYPQGTWIHVFTDESATNIVTSGKHCSNHCRNKSPLWCPLCPVGLSKPQAPKPGQSPTASYSYQEGFFYCVRCDDRAKSSGWFLLGSPPSAVVWQLAPRAWCPLQCLLAKTAGVLSPCVGRSEECAQEFAPQSHIHSGLNQEDLVSSDGFLSPQWPVRRQKMVVWVILSRVLIWSFCGSYPLFFNLQADFCFCFRRVLTSLYVVEKWGWGSFAAAFASLSAVSSPAMPTCAGTHWSTTLLLSDRVRRLLCSC